MITEIFRNLRVPIQRNVREGDEVLIISDPLTRELAEGLVLAVWAAGAFPTQMVITPPRVMGNEPPAMVGAAVRKADLVIAASSVSISHTDAIREGLKKGVRYLAMGGISAESIIMGSMSADFDEIQRLTIQYARIMSAGNTVEITSPQGTDITFSIKGRKALILDGRITEEKQNAALPGGEAACAPVEGTAHGVIVVDTAVQHIGFVKEPVILDVKKGRVEKISGGMEAVRLRELLEKNGDENSYNIAEFAIGTNPAEGLIHNVQEIKNKLGSSHIGLGDNLLLGGNVPSKTHLDCVMLQPTIKVDGKIVVKEGELAL